MVLDGVGMVWDGLRLNLIVLENPKMGQGVGAHRPRDMAAIRGPARCRRRVGLPRKAP